MEIEVLALVGGSRIERSLALLLNAPDQFGQALIHHCNAALVARLRLSSGERQALILKDLLQGLRVLQEGIPDLEAAHLEVKAPAHSLVNRYDAIGYLCGAIG